MEAARLEKLLERLRDLQERRPIDTQIQILDDLLVFTYFETAPELFKGKNVHAPLLLVLHSYNKIAGVQQIGWSLLCRLIEVCPDTLEEIFPAQDVETDWEMLSFHQQILNVLSLHSANLNLLTIVLKTLTLLLTSDSIVLLLLHEKEDVFQLLCDAMRTFPYDEDVQKYGCQALHFLFQKVTEEDLMEFVESKDHLVILDSLKQFHKEEGVVLPAFYALLSLAGPSNNVEVLMSGNVRCYNLIMESMKTFPDSENIQEVSCRLFQRLTLVNFLNILVSHEAYKVIAQAVLKYPENAPIQAAGLICLALLVETIFLNRDLEEMEEQNEEEEEETNPLCWLDAACTALQFHRNNSAVQEAACLVLNSLFMYHRDLHEKIQHGDQTYQVHKEIMLTMLTHHTSKEVFQAAANAMATLLEHNAHLVQVLLIRGIHMNVLEIMKIHSSSPDVAESACRLLSHLLADSSLNLDAMTMAASGIIHTMKRHASISSVQLEALRAISHLTMADDEIKQLIDSRDSDNECWHLTLKVIKNQCLLEGIHTLTLDALNKFLGYPAIQECGLRILCSVSECSGAGTLLSDQGAMDTVLHTLQMYPDNYGIQCQGLRLMELLINGKNLCISTVNLLAKLLVSVLQRFKDCIEIQKHGFETALTVIGLSQSFSKLLEQESFTAVLFYQINMAFNGKRDPQFKALSCKCFAAMIYEENLRNKLFEKACTDGNIMVAQCLLLLGADVNQKTNKDSLIYQVCEKGNNIRLVELLLNGGAREQDVREALNISIKKGNSEVISLLLRKLALDLANNSICLGGFRIGNIEPSWLSPLFPRTSSALKHEPDQERKKDSGHLLARMVLRHQRKQEESLADGTAALSVMISPESADECSSIQDTSIETAFYGEDDAEVGSETSTPIRKHPHSVSIVDQHREPFKLDNSPFRRRSSNSLGPNAEYNPSVCRRKTSGRQILKHSDSSSSLAVEREPIKALDLSENELETFSLVDQKASLMEHLEHLEKLELHQNSLESFPKKLCETLKCLWHLDVHSNRFTLFPSHILEITHIKYLDISRNYIGPSLQLSPTLRCYALKYLNLSYNNLTSIPECIGDVLEKLQDLILEGNKISNITSPLRLTELRTLNLTKNSISSLGNTIFEGCCKLDMFSVMMNILDTVPSLPSKLTTLKLHENTFISIPKEILQLTHLRSIDLSNNKIVDLPGPAHWASSNIRELVFSHNQIAVLNLKDDPSKWSKLEKLVLSHNKIKEIPPEIGFLENLTTFDVSHNPELRRFPDEMGKLTKVWDLPLDGLNLDLDLNHLGYKAKDIISFLQQRLKKAVPYNRMKLMIVGNTGSGKTTLVHQLMKCKHPDQGTKKATVGIDVKDWPVRSKQNTKKELTLNVWDFAGEEEFYSAHPHFMTQRALYLVVYDLSKGSAEVDSIKPWLFNIKARASVSPVILVGTHLDVSDEKCRKACQIKISKELFNQRGFPAIHDYHFVNASEESDSLKNLRKTIIAKSLQFKIREQPVVGQLIPDSYLQLEKRILHERKLVASEFPVIDQKRLLELVQESQLHLDENEIPHAVRFLNESGVLLHFEDPALQLRDLYFVDPQWLCKIMAQIFMVKQEGFSEYSKGVILRSTVEKFLSREKIFPEDYMSQYFKLLEKFQIALPLRKDQLLIPSSLSDHRPAVELPHCENSEIIVRLYEMPYFPMGFWSRLINRLLEISSYMLSGRERTLRPSKMYWRQGIYLSWSQEAYCLAESTVLDNNADSFLKVTVPCGRKGCILLGQIVDHIDSLMEEWFPGLLETDVCGEGETLLKKWVLYSFEDGQEHKQILLDDLLKVAEQGDLLVNPEDARSTIPIAQIAPDLVLADLPRNIMLNSDVLDLVLSPEFLLGDGGFGTVYRASYRGENVAVKIFNKHTSPRLLRQELTVLSHLRHPSLVSLLAAGIRPRMLVMELAPKGSLDRLLQQDITIFTRSTQHRIALHVADGLRYLHSAMIIYRDLKPHNVLLFTLYPSSAVIAKIADYGIAQYCCRMGIKSSEGTPGFRAPEVAKGNVIYNQQADVYSFGLLLYDILTNGCRIAEGLKFPNEFDELAIHGKLPDPVKEYNCDPWPEVENLIKHCMKQNPEDRPTSAKVYELLNSPELICLMRFVQVPSTFTAECMVVDNVSCKKPIVWIDNGRTDKGQLSRLDLNKGGHTCEDIADSRILCLAIVYLPSEQEHWILAGTQSGSLVVLNAEHIESKHCLQKMSDSITCLFCKTFSKQSKKKNFILVGTADGKIAIFEDVAIKCKDAAPIKIITVGDVSTPIVGLCESTYSSERNAIWGGCGTKIICLSQEFVIQKHIDTMSTQASPQPLFADANIISLAVDEYIYVAKKTSYIVEVWDRKTDKRIELINCVHFLRDAGMKSKESKQEVDHLARVKVLFLQKNTALWIGTGGGHLLLVDFSTSRPIRIITGFCDSIRCMVSTHLGKAKTKNVVLVLGCRFTPQKEVQSFLFVWNANLPHEVHNLKKHIEMRQELTDKMKSFSLD
ncbi:leucine-rich repeat serine/threonine-protein kinase 2 isoform X1 [Pleurodeles waltl]|uniref:leucine-rich repeat serine/threonine-protein kinase 2 isoform X1 n=2 Tax=Pleurodeles waltl TaxID=8319 RepID=UPI0037093D27